MRTAPGFRIGWVKPVFGFAGNATTTVVGKEQDQGVVELPLRLDLVDNAPDIAVEAVNHCRETNRFFDAAFLVLFADFLPRLVEVLALPYQRRHDNIPGNQAHLLLLPETVFANHIPSQIVELLKLLVVLRQRLQRIMSGLVRQVEKEGLVLCLGLFEEA